jgi:Rod binding domain-containing protein
MSIQAGTPTATAATTAGLPLVDQALEPAWVRHGSQSTQKAYESALSFEQTLVEQLTKSLADTSDLSGEASPEGEAGSEGSSAGASQLSSMLPQALTSSLMSAGGLGMAAQMTRQLQDVQAAHTQASGGTSAT